MVTTRDCTDADWTCRCAAQWRALVDARVRPLGAVGLGATVASWMEVAGNRFDVVRGREKAHQHPERMRSGLGPERELQTGRVRRLWIQ